MNLGIVCGCEGLLVHSKPLTACSRCRKTYPTKDLEIILKLLRVADYEPSSADQKPPTEDEKHNALTLATRRLIGLKLKVMDLDELQPQQVPRPAPPPPPPVYPSWTSTTVSNFTNPFGGVTYVHVRITVG